MSGKTVLLTNALSGAGRAACKALATVGYRVITLDFQRLPLGLRSRYSWTNHVLSATSQPDFEDGFLALIDRVRPDVLLPLGTRSVFTASKNREWLAARTAINVPALDAFLAAHDKSACLSECRQLGIPCAAAYSQDEALDILERGRGAVLVVKPDFNAGAASGIAYVRDSQQLRREVLDCTNRFGGALIQEYIPGGPEAMKTVVLLFSPESRLVAAFTTQKIRQWPPAGGLTAVSRSTAEEHLLRQVLPFFEKWRWRGAAEVELKFDSRDGRHKVIEINPRFPGYLRFPCECGLDLPVMAVEAALGATAACRAAFPAYVVGASYLSPIVFARTVLSDIRQGGLRNPELRNTLREMRAAGPLFLRLVNDPLLVLGLVLRRAFRTGRPVPEDRVRVVRPG